MNELLQKLDSANCVLDLGCGSGSFSHKDCPARVVALDQWLFDPVEARRRTLNGRVHYLLGSGAQLPLAPASVDLVVANHVFEHVEEPGQVAREVSRVLKPSGLLFATVPDGFSFSDDLYRWWTGGGGHLHRYTFRGFQETIESVTDLALLFACRLHASFSFLNPDARAARYLSPRSQYLKHLPRWAHLGVLTGVNVISRMADASLGTRLSLYGWAFYFGKPAAALASVPEEEHVNVCAFCGCGHSAGWLREMRRVQRRFGLRTFLCEVCGCRNPYFGPAYLRRMVRNAPAEEELRNPPLPPPRSEARHARGTGPFVERIVNAFHSASDLAPGTLTAIFGDDLAPRRETAGEEQWPLEMAGVQVLVNGRPAPLAYVSPEKILFQTPFSLARGRASFVVSCQGKLSGAVETTILLTAPALPSENQTGSGRGQFHHHSTWKPVTSDSPAKPAELVTFRALGLGPVVPPVPEGRPAGANPVSRTTRRATVKVGDQAAKVEYSGLAAETIGYYQVDLRLPSKLRAGEHPVYLEIGGRRSNVVTIPIS